MAKTEHSIAGHETPQTDKHRPRSDKEHKVGAE